MPLGPSRADLRGRDAAHDLTLLTQVCVIGSGAGGAMAALRLAEAGRDVLLVEAGGHHTGADFTQRDCEMLERLYAEDGRRGTHDQGVQIMCGRSVGGGTTHNTGYIYRAPPAILDRWRREAGFGVSEADVAAAYDRIAAMLGVTPIDAEALNPHNRLFWRGAEALGWRVRRTAHNRAPACSGCGYCMLGCAYDRKQGLHVTAIPQLLASGRLLSDAPVARVTGRPGQWRVEGWLRDGEKQPTGRQFSVKAADIVLAAGAIEGPALLQRSGLGGPAVGRSLRLHPAAPVAAFFEDDVVAWRGVPQGVMIEEFADFFDDGYGGYLLMPANATPALTSALLPGIGPAHSARMARLSSMASGAVLLHDETRGRVLAGPAPLRPRVRYWPDRADQRTLLGGVRSLGRLLLAAGATELLLPFVDTPPVASEGELDAALETARAVPHRMSLQSVHPQGSCPLGTDPRRSVVRPDLRLHDVPRFYLADASVFPCSIGVPPQMTAMLAGALCAGYLGAITH